MMANFAAFCLVIQSINNLLFLKSNILDEIDSSFTAASSEMLKKVFDFMLYLGIMY